MSEFDSAPTEMPEIPMAKGEVTEEYFSHVRKINDVYSDQIKISDQKAAYIFTFMLAFLVSSTEGRNVFNMSRYAHGNWIEIVLSAALALASVASIVFAILVVLPRQVDKTTSLFWGAWPQHRHIFEQAAERSDAGYLFREYLDNADALSMIARQKYRFVSLAFRGLMFTVLAYVLLLLATQNQV